MAARVCIQRKLSEWYCRNARDLPWRRTRDPYCIWVSEIMLQQTRVAAVIPYYERFLERFPDFATLAAAPESEVLRLWSGLGYYLRARNLQRAARQMAAIGAFPSTYTSIRALPGVGEYTAAAVASIAFGLPHAVVDGNVARVLSRVACRNDGLTNLAEDLLDTKAPGTWNQALMELGATLCLPRQPRCSECPLARQCRANVTGRQALFPARKRRPETVRVAKTLLRIERRGRLLLAPRDGFWELPDTADLPGAAVIAELGRFRHSIMNRSYLCAVVSGRLAGTPQGYRWFGPAELHLLPLSTMARKALALAQKQGGEVR